VDAGFLGGVAGPAEARLSSTITARGLCKLAGPRLLGNELAGRGVPALLRTGVLAWGLLVCPAVALSALPGVAQEAPARPGPERLTYQLYLVGNTGAGTLEDLSPTLRLLSSQVAEVGENSAVVFTGDLLPCCGMPAAGDPGRDQAEQRLMALVDAVGAFEGRVVVVPGDQDWGDDAATGWRSVALMEEFLEAAFDRGNVFVPDDGFPGPELVRLTDDLRLVALNTEWLLTDGTRPTGDTGDYDVVGDDDFYVELEDLITKRSTDDLIVVGHHPIISNGRYAGHYPPKTHFFPLTLAWDKAYVPLPLVGTAALGVRRSFGSPQHFAHMRNEWMRTNLDRLLLEHEDFVYVSAHDYSLQLHESGVVGDMQKYVVTGSAARTEYVADDPDTQWAFGERGFVSLHYYDDGAIWAEAWGVGADGHGLLLTESQLRDGRLVPVEQIGASGRESVPDYSDSTIVVAPEPSYDVGWFKRFVFGANHRDVWTTPVEVPYLDLGREHGGLTPVKRGGGMQTLSIRLEASDGAQYVLRSVNKDAQRGLPEEWRETLVAPISQDLVSKGHPYAAYIVPPLADAVGVFHTNPRLVWVPSDPRLGMYQDLVGNMLMLYEERPHNDMSHAPSFGRSTDVMGAPDMYRRVTRDNDDRVDARSLARARLFDMWMSDWDRHKDQWRWAEFDDPDGKGRIYRPVPRDRDQAFLRMDFFLHRLIKPFMKTQDYRESYGSIKGLTKNAMEQDHRFLAPLEREDWVTIADSMRSALTDEVIESAFRLWPEPVFRLHGAEMIRIAKARRDQLTQVAEEFYRLHARSVDVVGSERHERFEVHRLDDGYTEVVVYKTSREGEIDQEIFRRTMWRGETDEIVLYGLGGEDRFFVSGTVDEGIMVHAVGGTGDDTFVDSSYVGGGGKKTHFLDSRESGWASGLETETEVGRRPVDSDYTGFFQYPRSYPFGLVFYTKDDGVVFGGGAVVTEHAFGKEPFARLHRFGGSFATETGAWRLQYGVTARERLGDWNLGLRAEWANPDNIHNFYGMGNETPPESEIDSVRIRLGHATVEVPFTLEKENGLTLEVGPRLTRTDVGDEQSFSSPLPQPGLSPFTTEPQWHAGVGLSLDLEYRDDPLNPRQGYRWTTLAEANLGVGGTPDQFATVGSDLALYTSLRTRRQATLGVRLGGTHTFGTFPFFSTNSLGGQTNLRGYRETRFSGRSTFYSNTEVRVELFDIGGTILPGTLGTVGFFDVGRVWTDGESSSSWHKGYGGGLWYDIAGEITIRMTGGWSDEGLAVLFGAGFFF